jgi:hypothetical protein
MAPGRLGLEGPTREDCEGARETADGLLIAPASEGQPGVGDRDRRIKPKTPEDGRRGDEY